MPHTTTGRPATHNVLVWLTGFVAFVLVGFGYVGLIALILFLLTVAYAVHRDTRFNTHRAKVALR